MNYELLFILFLLFILILITYNSVCYEKYSHVKNNNFIDIFNNEQVQLKKGSTARQLTPPTLKQALYSDKLLIY